MPSSRPQETTGRLVEQFASLEYILLGDLRDLLEEPPDRGTARWMAAVLDALLDTLPRKFQLQEDGGYMAEVLDEFPNWSGEVQKLLAEREALFDKLRTLRERLAGRVPYRKIAGQLRHDLREWMNSLNAFHRHERRLIQTAFNLDVGIGD